MMEVPPTSVTEGLAGEIRKVINALLPAHVKQPEQDEIVSDPQPDFLRLQDWVFTMGFALVKGSTRPNRWVLHCIHHHKDTRNSRHTKLEDRKRLGTNSQVKNCKFSMYLSRRRKINDSWAIEYTFAEHDHPMNPDPFQYIVHRDLRPGRTKSVEIARGL